MKIFYLTARSSCSHLCCIIGLMGTYTRCRNCLPDKLSQRVCCVWFETSTYIMNVTPKGMFHMQTHVLLFLCLSLHFLTHCGQGDADLRFYVTTVQDGWRRFAFLTRWNSVHLQVLLSATPQRGMFPEVSHPQALLGSLMSISWKLQFTKTVSEFVINF